MTHNMVGFTTTIPLEILVAAGRRPVDLNNIFITAPDPQILIEDAEIDGFPRNICAWIKGLYGAVVHHDIREVIAVTEGDCSNTRALMEVLSQQGTSTVPFSYPHDRSRRAIARQIDNLAGHFGVTRAQIEETRKELNRVRTKVHEIDRLSWQEDRVNGEESNFYQLCTSDMNGDVAAYEQQLDAFLEQARTREPRQDQLRLAYIGVPPIVSGLYTLLEEMQARVVFNETQRQFSMPFSCADIEEQYLRYTYPYDIFTRLEDIHREVKLRRIDGVIHYVQSFCFRQIEDLIIRKQLDVPVLTLEGDRPGPVDARGRIRLEGFVEMLKGRKS